MTQPASSSQVRDVHNMVVNLSQQISSVSADVATVSGQTQENRRQIDVLTTEFLKYVRKAELAENYSNALAHKNNLESRLHNEFGHLDEVRRSATGVLQGFDTGLLSKAMVRETSERLLMMNPGYWLAPALAALGAWAADDRELCERAIKEANRLDPAHTALFMALVLRRQDRMDSSLRWLGHYLDKLDPNALGRHFAVILESVAQGAFGPTGMDLVENSLDRWQAELLKDEAKQQAQVALWRHEVERHAGPGSQGKYPRLAAQSAQFAQMEAGLARAQAHARLIAKYTALRDEERPPAGDVEDAVDDIIDQLVTRYHEPELPLRRQHAMNEGVIRHRGDEAAAQRDLAYDLAAFEKTLDYLTVQTKSALEPDELGVSRSTQRIAVASCHSWFASAHASYSADYRRALPQDVEITFGGDHNIGAKVFRLPPWTGSFKQPADQLERGLAGHWDAAAKPFVDSFRFDWGKESIIPGLVTAAALVVLAVCLKVPGVLIALVGGGIWFGILYMRSQTAAKLQHDAEAFLARAKQDSIQQLRAATAELHDWSTEFREADTQEGQVRALIDDLSRSGATSSPFERRVAGPSQEAA